MRKLFMTFLASNRKRRYLIVSIVIWLLRILRDIENDEAARYSDLLDNIDYDTSRFKYNDTEDRCLDCEIAATILCDTIDELKSVF